MWPRDEGKRLALPNSEIAQSIMPGRASSQATDMYARQMAGQNQGEDDSPP